MSSAHTSDYLPARGCHAALGGLVNHCCRFLLGLATIVFGVAAGGVVWAGQGSSVKALLVGVSEYPHLADSWQLQGPRNDVERLRNVLVQRGVPASAITVLADGVPGAELPTRAKILEQLDRLARSTKSSDHVVISFGGHGAQLPVPPGDPLEAQEPDGLFEVFLPRDAQGWTKSPEKPAGDARNVLYDYEIRVSVDRIAATGAFVWVIFDACHSATMVRSDDSRERVRLRQVPAEGLGVPQEVIDRAVFRAAAHERQPHRAPVPASDPGRAVYFYAAQTTEATPEMPLPAGQHPSRVHGLFTHVLAQTLEGGAGMTYRQLYQQVLARYGSTSNARSTPIAAGTQLDAPVLGLTAPQLRQWSMHGNGRLAAQAGALTDLVAGSIVAVMPNAVAPDAEVMGYARVRSVTLAESELEPIDFGGRPRRTREELASGAVARLIRPAPILDLTVSVDLRRGGAGYGFDTVIARLERLFEPGSDEIASLPIRWVGPGQAAHLALVAAGDRLFLLPPALAGDPLCTHLAGVARSACDADLKRSVAAVQAGQGERAQALAGRLHRMVRAAAKAENILRVATLAGQTGMARHITTELHVERNGQRVTAAEHALTCGAADTLRLPSAQGVAGGTCLRAKDRVFLNVGNSGNRSFDLTVLYVDGRFGVVPMFPRPGSVNRVEVGARVRVALEIDDQVTGMERLVLVAIESSSSRLGTIDLSFLAQPSLQAPDRSRSGQDAEEDEAISLFRAAGFGEGLTTRGGTRATVPMRVGAQVFSWQVVKPSARDRQ